MSSFGSPPEPATGDSTSAAAASTEESPALQTSPSASQTTSSSLSSSSTESSSTLSLGSPQLSQMRPFGSTSGPSKTPSIGYLLDPNSLSPSNESDTTPPSSVGPTVIRKRGLGSSYTISQPDTGFARIQLGHSNVLVSFLAVPTLGSPIKLVKKPAFRSTSPSGSSPQHGFPTTEPIFRTSSTSAFGSSDQSSSSTQHGVPTTEQSIGTSSVSAFVSSDPSSSSPQSGIPTTEPSIGTSSVSAFVSSDPSSSSPQNGIPTTEPSIGTSSVSAFVSSDPSSSSPQSGTPTTEPSFSTSSASAFVSSDPSSSSTQNGIPTNELSSSTSSASAFVSSVHSSSSTQHGIPTNELSSSTSSGSSFGSTLSYGSTFSSNNETRRFSTSSFLRPVAQTFPAVSHGFRPLSQASTPTHVTRTSLFGNKRVKGNKPDRDDYDLMQSDDEIDDEVQAWWIESRMRNRGNLRNRSSQNPTTSSPEFRTDRATDSSPQNPSSASLSVQSGEMRTANMDDNGSRQSADESLVSTSESSSFRNIDKLRSSSPQDPPTSSPPEFCAFGLTNSSSQNSSSAFGSVQSSAIPTPSGDGSNTIRVSVPSSGFAQVSFIGLPFVICLNDNGQGSGQTMPCVITFSQSTSATLTINCPRSHAAQHTSGDGSNGSGDS